MLICDKIVDHPGMSLLQSITGRQCHLSPMCRASGREKLLHDLHALHHCNVFGSGLQLTVMQEHKLATPHLTKAMALNLSLCPRIYRSLFSPVTIFFSGVLSPSHNIPKSCFLVVNQYTVILTEVVFPLLIPLLFTLLVSPTTCRWFKLSSPLCTDWIKKEQRPQNLQLEISYYASV